jgi:hypothetical protein
MIMNIHLFAMEVVLINLIENQLLFDEDHLQFMKKKEEISFILINSLTMIHGDFQSIRIDIC